MELLNLKHFLALAEEQDMTRAAARELIVQSSLSLSITVLERDAGASLYVRNSRPIQLTAVGKALVPYARKVLAAAEEADRVVREVHGAVSGQLNLGIFKAAAEESPLVGWLNLFADIYPKVRVRIIRIPDTQTDISFEAGLLDVVIAADFGMSHGAMPFRL